METDYEKLITDRNPLKLGSGSFRRVYEHPIYRSRVIKEAHYSGAEFHNWMEWWVWSSAPEHIKRYLAPIHDISKDGKYLVMEKAKPYLTSRHEFPPEVLDNFRDLTMKNLGTITRGFYSRPVIIDYALPSITGWNPEEGYAPHWCYANTATAAPYRKN